MGERDGVSSFALSEVLYVRIERMQRAFPDDDPFWDGSSQSDELNL